MHPRLDYGAMHDLWSRSIEVRNEKDSLQRELILKMAYAIVQEVSEN